MATNICRQIYSFGDGSMISRVFAVLCLASVVGVAVGQGCYWSDGCVYQLYSSKTPYDAVRGDIRDHPIPANCRAVSLWSLNRHGNRNPGSSSTAEIRVIADLKQEIIDSYYAGRGQLCAQDIENFKKWQWNETLEISQSFLTGTGYEELYGIAKRLREKYPHLAEGTEEDFYFRSTNAQRTVTSGMAFIHGWTENSGLDLVQDDPWPRDDIIKPYENCDRYQEEVKGGPKYEEEINAYFASAEYATVQRNVQNRIGITTQLSTEDIFSIYEMCRFLRSWEPDFKSPWCAAFTQNDLEVLEYRDDVRHYYRNAHGSWVNRNLGKIPLKDLFERFDSYVQNGGKKMVAYFTHNTILEMVTTALQLHLDPEGVIQGAHRDPNRLWRASYIGCFSTNFLAVLNRCEESTGQTYRVQLFQNEKVTDVCPLEGCTWQQFRDKFQGFTTADLDFCSMDARVTEPPQGDGAATIGLATWMLILALAACFR